MLSRAALNYTRASRLINLNHELSLNVVWPPRRDPSRKRRKRNEQKFLEKVSVMRLRTPTNLFGQLILGPRRVLCLGAQRALREEQPLLVVGQTHAKRSPCHQADTDFVVHFRQVQLGTFAAEHVILGLLQNWRDAIKLTTIGVSFHYFSRRPF